MILIISGSMLILLIIVTVIILFISNTSHILVGGKRLENETGIRKVIPAILSLIMPIFSVIITAIMKFIILFVDKDWFFKGPFRRLVPWILGNAIVKIAYACEIYTTEELIALYENLYVEAEENEAHLHFSLSPCICRHAMNNWSDDMPNMTCLHLNFAAKPAGKNIDQTILISAKTAIQLTKEYASKWPFVLTVFGICPSSPEYFDKQFAVCFCHHHCAVIRCEVKRGKYGLHPITKGHYIAEIDETSCVKCGICYEKCPFFIITKDKNDNYEIDPEKCFGCGVCERFCPNDAIKLIDRPKSKDHFIRRELLTVQHSD